MLYEASGTFFPFQRLNIHHINNPPTKVTRLQNIYCSMTKSLLHRNYLLKIVFLFQLALRNFSLSDRKFRELC